MVWSMILLPKLAHSHLQCMRYRVQFWDLNSDLLRGWHALKSRLVRHKTHQLTEWLHTSHLLAPFRGFQLLNIRIERTALLSEYNLQWIQAHSSQCLMQTHSWLLWFWPNWLKVKTEECKHFTTSDDSDIPMNLQLQLKWGSCSMALTFLLSGEEER